MEFALYLSFFLWLSLLTNAWYVVLIPFWIMSAFGLYYRSIKFPLFGLVFSFTFSWIIVIVAVLLGAIK